MLFRHPARLDHLVELWDKGLIAASENAAKSPAKKGGEVKYSVKEGMSEEEAHKYVEKAAMDAGIAKKLAAQLIIDNYLK